MPTEGNSLGLTVQEIKKDPVLRAWKRLLGRWALWAFPMFLFVSCLVVAMRAYNDELLRLLSFLPHGVGQACLQLVVLTSESCLAAIAALVLVQIRWEGINAQFLQNRLRAGVFLALADSSEDDVKPIDVLASIDLGHRKKLLKNLFTSLGDAAVAIFETNVSPYLDSIHVRRRFETTVTLRRLRWSKEAKTFLDKSGMVGPLTQQESNSGPYGVALYDELHQVVYYEKPSLFSRASQIAVCFAFDIRTFNHLLHDHTIFWRELLHFEDAFREAILRLPSEQLDGFVRHILRFEVTPSHSDHRQLVWSASWGRKEGVPPYLKILVQLPSDIYRGSSLRARKVQHEGMKIMCNLPQKKRMRWWHVVFIEPTFVEHLEFHYDSGEFLVDDASFMRDDEFEGRSAISRSSGIIRFAPGGFVIPRSGMTFIWSDADRSR